MNSKDFFKVDFADRKDVNVTLVSIGYTFSGHLEGSFHTSSEHILEDIVDQAEEEGYYFKFTPDQILQNEPLDWDIKRAKETDLLKPNEVLRPYFFRVDFESDSSERLTIYWFGDAPAADATLRDIVSAHTKGINFDEEAYKIDLDDF